MFEHRAQLKAILGIIQLAFGIIQLVETSGALVYRYGIGCYVFTIIPYALASLINGLAAIFTPQYSEIQEVRLKDNVRKEYFIATFHFNKSFIMTFWHVYLELMTYLVIVGSMTGFHKQESTIAQRGWLISWAIVGIITGAILGLWEVLTRVQKDDVIEGSTKNKAIAGEVNDEVIKGEETKDEVIEGEGNDEAIETQVRDKAIEGGEKKDMAIEGEVIEGEVNNEAIETEVKDEAIKDMMTIYLATPDWAGRMGKLYVALAAIIYGVPTFGGLVVLSQQYLTNFICTE